MPITTVDLSHTVNADLILLTGRGGWSERWGRAALWLAWLLATAWLAADHAVWRDEVRAFNLALSGRTVAEMLVAIHGEGHPALWYLLLRGGHALTGMREVLPATAYLIAAAATALIAWRAPFRPLVIALILFSAYALIDYTIVARNYGISMLLMAAIADRYAMARDRGITLGILLFLLCNTNAPSVLLAGGLLLFWAIELWLEQGWHWTPAVRHFVLNAAITAVGVATCILVLYPPYNDAASLAAGSDGLLPFAELSAGVTQSPAGAILFGGLLLGSLAGLSRAPAALGAAVAVAGAGAVFFHVVYPGRYRHEALILVFLLTMYWLVARGRGGRWRATTRRWTSATSAAQRYGVAAFVGLLALQTVLGLGLFAYAAHGQPFSRSRDLGVLLHRPGLNRAVVIANPDVLLEPLSYYAPNPVYLVRERRWGRVVAFTKAAIRDVSLSEMLVTARNIKAHTGRPIVIALSKTLDPNAPAERWDQGFLGGFTTTPENVSAFLKTTRRIARLAPAQTDESYDVYLLR